jgi:hypothetical protein
MQHSYKAGDNVKTANTDTGESEIWTVENTTADGLTLTRAGVAPWTSMDQIMGNGRAPTRGTWTRTIRFKSGCEVETVSEVFTQ